MGLSFGSLRYLIPGMVLLTDDQAAEGVSRPGNSVGASSSGGTSPVSFFNPSLLGVVQLGFLVVAGMLALKGFKEVVSLVRS